MLIPLPECETRGCLLRTLEFYHGKRSKKVRQPSLSANHPSAVQKNRFVSPQDSTIQTRIARAARERQNHRNSAFVGNLLIPCRALVEAASSNCRVSGLALKPPHPIRASPNTAPNGSRGFPLLANPSTRSLIHSVEYRSPHRAGNLNPPWKESPRHAPGLGDTTRVLRTKRITKIHLAVYAGLWSARSELTDQKKNSHSEHSFLTALITTW